MRSQSFEFVFEAKFFFFQGRYAHLIPTTMRHFGFDKLLDFLMFNCDFRDV